MDLGSGTAELDYRALLNEPDEVVAADNVHFHQRLYYDVTNVIDGFLMQLPPMDQLSHLD